MGFLSSLNISGSGMTAQRMRLDVATENIANINTTRTSDGDAYRRKMVVFEEQKSFEQVLSEKRERKSGVVVSEVVEDTTELKKIYDPTHPDADEEGYVSMPNIDLIKETADAMAATRSYEANITAFNSAKFMAQKAIEIGK